MGSVLCVLFTDLAGSTELMTRLGDVAFDKLRVRHFAELRDVIAGTGGTEIKNTGDGLLATFTSAVEALRAATGIQQVTDAHGRPARAPLAVRVGVALGEVTLEGGDVFGTPVVEAARLVAAARPGQILATAVVRMVTGTRAGVPFTDLGAMELKGLPEPVLVCEIGWEPLDPEVPPLPLPGLLRGTGRVFVGRDNELGRLRDRWKKADAEGRRSIVLLGGEPGIGKTRLAAELAASLHARGAMVLAGRCDEDLGVPYQPFVEAVRHYTAHAAAPLRLGRHPGELARLVPELADLVAGLPEPLRSDPETERYRLFESLSSWLADASAATPVLLVLDDLHWAAKPTLLLLRHVLRSDETMRLLVVATYRDTETAPGDAFGDFLGDLPRLDDAECLPVSGLDAGGVVDYLHAAAGHDLDAEGLALADTVWRETDGNCFFVTEVLRHLAETGALEERDGRWSTTAAASSIPIPTGVRDVIARRLSRLPEQAQRVLAVAAVAGLEFDPAVIEAAGGFTEDEILTALEAAAAARLVVETPTAGAVPRNRFAHALVRSTLHDQLTAARRRSLHRHIAEAIERIDLNHLDDHLPALAHHWARSGADNDKATDYAGRAGTRALAQLAFDEAAAFFSQALALIGSDDARRLDLLISFGDAQRRAGDAKHRETLLEAARLAEARSDAGALARAALASSRLPYWSRLGALDQERVRVLETALEAIGEVISSERARLLAALAVELVWSTELERRAALSDEAIRLGRAVNDPTTLAIVLMGRFYAINTPDTLSGRMADAGELLELAGRLADPMVALMAHFLRARVSLESGDVHEMELHLPQAERFATEVGQPTFRWLVGWLKTGRLLLAGRIGEAERELDATVALGLETGQPDAEGVSSFQLALIRFEQDRLGEIEAQLAERASGRLVGIPGMQAITALAACQPGREDEARARYDRLRAIGFDLPRDPLWLGVMSVSAEVTRYLHDVHSAERLYELLAPYPTSFGLLASAPVGCTAYYLGLLATMTERFDAAEDHFRQATLICERVAAPAFLGRARIEWARMLLARSDPGDLTRARTLLDQASAVATELDLAEIGRRSTAVKAALP